MYPRLSSYVHDPITATCLVLENGNEQYVMVSLDMVNTPKVCCDRFRSRLSGIPGLDVSKVAFNAIHSHNSLRGNYDPHLTKFRPLSGITIAWKLFQCRTMCSMVTMKSIFWQNGSKRLFDAPGTAENQVASPQRRTMRLLLSTGVLFSEAKTGKRWQRCMVPVRRDHFLRLEGYSDHTVNMLYTFDTHGTLTGILVDAALSCTSLRTAYVYFC